MAISVRLYPNNFKGGECCSLWVEGLTEPDTVLNKKCKVRLFEMDTVSGKGEKPGSKDLLAEFETVIMAGTKKNVCYFDQAKTKRTDQYINVLPGPEYKNDAAGNLLPEPLNYKPAYFDFAFDFGAIHPTGSYCILIQGSPLELEYYNYEISFSVEIDGKEIFNSFKMQAIVDCNNILAENCVNAAKYFKENHDGMLATRNVGTHYGNKYKYILPNEDGYLRQVQRELNLTNEQRELLRGQTQVWDESAKKKFDADNKRYKLKQTSCIDYVMDCFEIAHKKAGMEADWKNIADKVVDKIGQSLAKELVNYNWVALYYNPDVKNPWDNQKFHTDSYNQAITKRTYGSNIVVPVFDMVVNYSPQTKDKDELAFKNPTQKESDQISKLLEVPFAFLMSRDSLHTAMFIKGKVYEVHWDIGPYFDSKKNTTVISNVCDFIFDPKRKDLTWQWLSGLIVMPRMFWPKARYTI
jgi:hypothetical protein